VKILCVADPHLTSTNLAIRKDDFPTVVFDKIHKTLDMAVELKVDLYNVVGDLFHNKSVSYGYVNRLVDLFGAYKGKFDMSCVYGNHDCLAPGTDVLTESGWVSVEDCYHFQGKVAQFDIKTGKVSFDYPLAFIKSFADCVYDIESSNSRQVVSGGHDVIINNAKVKARDLKLHPYINKFRLFGNKDIPDFNISDDMLRLLVWVIADGCLVYCKDKPKRVQFKLSKERKLSALTALLSGMGYKYTYKVCKKVGINVLQPFYIRIYGDYARAIFSLLGGEKNIPRFFRLLSARQVQLVFDTYEITDGHRTACCLSIVSVVKKDIDMLQEMAICNGAAARVFSTGSISGFKNGKPQHGICINTKGKIINNAGRGKIKITKLEHNNIVYCLTMPLGTLITRYGGKVAFTGNCISENPESVPRTPLGNLFAHKLFVPKVGNYVLEYDDCICVMMPFMAKPSSFTVPNPNNKKLVLFAHYFLESKFDGDEVLPPELTNIFDYIFLGHEHDPYPITKVGKAVIIRPGALSRGTRHRSQWNRPIQVAYLDTVTGECSYIPIPCSPAEEIFNTEGLDIQKRIEEARDVSTLSGGVELSSAAKAGDLLIGYGLRDEVLKRTHSWLQEAGIQ
jgi:DNA repair exonuclease SbcCD nuclease subunit